MKLGLLSGGATAVFIEAGTGRAQVQGRVDHRHPGRGRLLPQPGDQRRLDNSDWVFLLRQKPESIELMAVVSSAWTMQEAAAVVAAHRARVVFRSVHPFADRQRHRPADPRSVQPAALQQPPRGLNAIDAKRAAGLPIDPAIDAVLQERGISARSRGPQVALNMLLSAGADRLRHQWLARERRRWPWWTWRSSIA